MNHPKLFNEENISVIKYFGLYSYCKPRPLDSWLVTCAVHSEMVHSTNSVIDLSEDELVPAVVYQISPFTLIRFSVRRRELAPAQA